MILFAKVNSTDFIITPDKFLSLASNYVSRYGKKITYDPKENIIFLHGDNMTLFMQDILPNINYKFTLITHDADAPITTDYLPILENHHLIKWFGMNCHIMHRKLQPVPIGMANECWPHGNKDTMLKIINKKNTKSNLAYCNFDPHTNIGERSHALSQLRECNFVDFDFAKHSYEDYLDKLSTYKYVISPPGNSVDCHRIWESIYVGTIPIVIKSIPMVFFKDCPILFVNDWNDVTQDFLNLNYKKTLYNEITKSDFRYYKQLIFKSSKQTQ